MGLAQMQKMSFPCSPAQTAHFRTGLDRQAGLGAIQGSWLHSLDWQQLCANVAPQVKSSSNRRTILELLTDCQWLRLYFRTLL